MPQQFNLTVESNGHKPLETDLVTLEKSLNNSKISEPEVTKLDTNKSVDDWSFATKELLDALPQRWTRGLLYLLIIFVAIALPWGMFSQVDETGTARGRLEPQGGTLKQELNLTFTAATVYTQTAKVEKVYVKEGDKIEAGDILIELESRPIRDRLAQLNIQLQSQQNRLSKIEQQKSQLEIELRTQERQNQSQTLEKLAQVEQVRRNFQSLNTTYNLQEEEKLAQVHQAEQNLEAARRILNLQREEKLAQVHQAEQNLEAARRILNLQREEKLAQVNQVKQQLDDSNTAYKLSEIRWQKSLREVERYRNLWEEGAVTEIQVVEKEDIAEERQRIWEQSQADREQAKLRIEEQEGSYDRVIHQAEADIEQAELRLAEQKGSYERIINQAEADIKQAELRLTEQKSSYERTINQAKADIEQAELRLTEQENSSQTITHSGEIAISKIKEQLKNMDSQIISIQAEIAQTKKDIDSLNFELDQRVVRAQQGGIIFNLPIEGVGDVVQQGEMIVEVSPQGKNLFLKAEMATSESGSLKKGMEVKMKFDAYPFQDYGVVEGTLKNISPTSKMQETAEGNIAIYELEIELDETCIPAANECIALRPGDTATAEVVVRQRRLIDFILDPFKKLQKGGLDL
ncbi:MAG: HlyD family efflux transporter periplasmic adaptor subunit [Okeania sp. SIO2G4]|uniref:HlyD family efflux transporter periplasmic adaptor subunit n=1 Tax=unclassified Okeania TaxID=2634635 RepID=UPI0013B8B22D|nr:MULTISPECIES: HlyD family efflux transporter periplasmic adaptor subunit [unclassified Okeania]NEP39531.1 HlyD family efflux transporter periplasmic adaptor subunit [Okeania sp. SIO2H7]NEP72238.1 HlyD family efflux transporter periplasmic adaptor subunit [Okeania sp. SIO2G5]NEP92243.1 HlyD family efflux transporter periplasmic adaptor subunit [Okeania sp. SIO2F5]NEQ90518.1 HlyD family efflux transporter periplasmic adaptor subunit [Okeania sp. SIO2G4]